MADPAVSTPTIDAFFQRWEASGAAERANYSMFLNELCDLLDVSRPDPAGPDNEKNAYGCPHDLTDEEILRRLVDLNRERAEEEKRGIIRWLRPEYQNPDGAQPAAATQGALAIEPEAPAASPAIAGAKRPWPKTLPEQAQAVRAVLADQPIRPDPRPARPPLPPRQHPALTDMLNTLVSLGQARALEGGRYVPT